jgi:FMN reductase (NADPH)
MKGLNMNKVVRLLKRHRSVRTFAPEPVSEETVSEIIRAGQWAPTSNYIQAYSIIRVKDKAVRKQMAALAGDQPWVEESPVFLVFCADLKRAQTACDVEGSQMVSGFTEQFIIATVDVSLSAQNIMIAAESLGLGGVYIGGLRNDPQTVCDLLDLPDQVYPVFGMCLGYPAQDQEQKPRLPADVVLKSERYFEDPERLKAYNKICQDYYRRRAKGARQDTWTGQIARMVGQPARPHMRSFLESRGFEFK